MNKSNDSWPAIAAFCFVAVTHAYLLFHCAPYLGYMAYDLLQPSGSRVSLDSVGGYAGLLGTAFTTGRCLGFVPWKRLRHNKHAVLGGNTRTLLLSLILSAAGSLWFGLAQSYESALLARFCLGLSNALSGCLKRIAINHQAKHEHCVLQQQQQQQQEEEKRRTVWLTPAKVLGFMWWGSVLGPFLGGVTSNPMTYDHTTKLLPSGVQQAHPYLLPNLVAVGLCLVSFVAVALFVVDEEQEGPGNKSRIADRKTSFPEKGTAEESRSLLSSSSPSQPPHALRVLWNSPTTRSHFLAYWTLSFAVVCIEEALPLFLIARGAAPGLAPQQIGILLSTAALLVVASQMLRWKDLALALLDETTEGTSSWTLHRGLNIAAVLAVLPAVLLPITLILDGGAYMPDLNEINGDVGHPGEMSVGVFIFLVIVLGVLYVASTTYYSLIGVATGRTVPPIHKDESARMMTLGALCARAVAPLFAGVLVSIFMSQKSYVSATALWLVIGLVVGLSAAAFTFSLAANGRNALRIREERQSLARPTSVTIFAKLWEEHESKLLTDDPEKSGDERPKRPRRSWHHP